MYKPAGATMAALSYPRTDDPAPRHDRVSFPRHL